MPVIGQTPAAKSKAYVPLKLPWGDPDLQGVWPATELIGTPLQRDAKIGQQTVLTDEEFADRQSKSAQQAAADSEEFARNDGKVGVGPPAYWVERGKAQRIASLVVDPPDGRIPPITEQAKQGRGDADSWTDRSLYDRCISRGVMGSILPVIYNNGTQIVQAPGFVAIRYEMIHETKIIPLDGSSHPGSNVKSYMGDSRVTGTETAW
jgi:hypothetical protein